MVEGRWLEDWWMWIAAAIFVIVLVCGIVRNARQEVAEELFEEPLDLVKHSLPVEGYEKPTNVRDYNSEIIATVYPGGELEMRVAPERVVRTVIDQRVRLAQLTLDIRKTLQKATDALKKTTAQLDEERKRWADTEKRVVAEKDEMERKLVAALGEVAALTKTGE